MPTTVVKTIRASGGDYTTLSAWEAAQQGNLVAADEIRVAECYNDWPSGLNDSVTVAGWTTDSTRYPKITVAEGHRHDGTPGTGFFITKYSNYGATVACNQANARIEWVEAKNTGEASTVAFSITAGVANQCIASAGTTGFSGMGNGGDSVLNSLALSCGAGYTFQNWEVGSVLNCVAASCGAGFTGVTNGSGPILKNCVAYNNTANYNGAVFNSASTNNATSSASDDAPGGNSVWGITSADFVDAANNDFHLAAGSALIGAGTNLYSTFTTDIDGDTWPSSGAWDIGFDYYVATGGATTHTKTSSANAVLQQTQIKTLSASAVLNASAITYTKTSSASALLQKGFTLSSSSSALLQKSFTATASASAKLQQMQVRTASASAILAEPPPVTNWDDDTQSWDSDTTIWDGVTGGVLVSASAALQKVFTKTASADAKLQKSHDRFVSHANAKLQKTQEIATSASAVLGANQTKSFSVNAVLLGQGQTLVSASAVLQKSLAVTASASAVLTALGTSLVSANANALLQKAFAQATSASAILSKAFTKTSSASAVLEKTLLKQLSASAVLALENPSVTTYANALLQKNILTAVSASAIISKTGWVEAAGVSNSWTQESGVTNPWTHESAAVGSWT